MVQTTVDYDQVAHLSRRVADARKAVRAALDATQGMRGARDAQIALYRADAELSVAQTYVEGLLPDAEDEEDGCQLRAVEPNNLRTHGM